MADLLQIIAQALLWTLLVLSISLALSFALGTLLGMIIAWKRRTALNPIITFYAAFTGATPDYVTALVLMIIFAVNLRWFPIAGGYDPRLAPGFNWPFIASVISHSTLPVIAYTFENTAAWALAMKGSAVSVLGEDYITAARARGLRGRRILTAYVGRNAMLPMITALAISLGTMLGGSTLIENIYSYPGIGRFNADALTRRDVGLMQGLFLFQAIAIILANFFATCGTLIYTPGAYQACPDKSQTYSVEADNAELRHYLARLARKSRCFSRCIHALWRAVKLFVFAWNRRQMHKRIFPQYPAHVKDFMYP